MNLYPPLPFSQNSGPRDIIEVINGLGFEAALFTRGIDTSANYLSHQAEIRSDVAAKELIGLADDIQGRVVQKDFRQEIEVFYVLFDRFKEAYRKLDTKNM